MNLLSVYQAHQAVLPGAVEFLWRLLQERPAAANISHTGMPSPNEHYRFVHSKPYRRWFVIVHANQWVGSVHASYLNELGIAILHEHRGRGFATLALRSLMADLRPLAAIPGERRGTWIANVAPGNAASHALFKKLGGREIQTTYEL